jgi:hypothetical protein
LESSPRRIDKLARGRKMQSWEINRCTNAKPNHVVKKTIVYEIAQ